MQVIKQSINQSINQTNNQYIGRFHKQHTRYHREPSLIYWSSFSVIDRRPVYMPNAWIRIVDVLTSSRRSGASAPHSTPITVRSKESGHSSGGTLTVCSRDVALTSTSRSVSPSAPFHNAFQPRHAMNRVEQWGGEGAGCTHCTSCMHCHARPYCY